MTLASAGNTQSRLNDSYASRQDGPNPDFGPLRLRQRPLLLSPCEEPRAKSEVIGQSAELLNVMHQVSMVARTESTVLVQGETGTGKELVARAVHDGSSRKHGPFVKLNVAAIVPNLLESELFGHERGAFTGAHERRLGRFEQAEAGTLFLDEIGELALELQPKLLRVLQEREFERVGGTRTVHSNVRLVAATNRDLGALVQAGRFRADLYYRLNIFPIEVPPLRQRTGDIALLAAHFVEELCRRFDRPGLRLSQESVARLERHVWPGNIRELQSVLERAVILSSGVTLEVQPLGTCSESRRGDLDLEAFIRQRLLPQADALYADTHNRVDCLLLKLALDHMGNNHRDAARLLGISRQTLRMKLRALGLQAAPLSEPA